MYSEKGYKSVSYSVFNIQQKIYMDGDIILG